MRLRKKFVQRAGLSMILGALMAATSLQAKDPVVLVHGFVDWGIFWGTMQSRLNSEGYQHHTLSYNSYRGVPYAAGKLRDFVNSRTGSARINIVAHSMGGLVSRYYMKNLGGSSKVGRLITLGTPHKGTNLAYLCFFTSCYDMRSGSSLLNGLGTNQCDKAIYSPCDEIINPDSSAKCGSTWRTSCQEHAYMMISSTTWGKVRTWLQ